MTRSPTTGIFGDGATLDTTDPTISHTFTHEGAFKVTLRVEDDARLSAPVTRLVEVGHPPSATPEPLDECRLRLPRAVPGEHGLAGLTRRGDRLHPRRHRLLAGHHRHPYGDAPAL